MENGAWLLILIHISFSGESPQWICAMPWDSPFYKADYSSFPAGNVHTLLQFLWT